MYPVRHVTYGTNTSSVAGIKFTSKWPRYDLLSSNVKYILQTLKKSLQKWYLTLYAHTSSYIYIPLKCNASFLFQGTGTNYRERVGETGRVIPLKSYQRMDWAVYAIVLGRSREYTAMIICMMPWLRSGFLLMLLASGKFVKAIWWIWPHFHIRKVIFVQRSLSNLGIYS